MSNGYLRVRMPDRIRLVFVVTHLFIFKILRCLIGELCLMGHLEILSNTTFTKRVYRKPVLYGNPAICMLVLVDVGGDGSISVLISIQ